MTGDQCVVGGEAFPVVAAQAPQTAVADMEDVPGSPPDHQRGKGGEEGLMGVLIMLALAVQPAVQRFQHLGAGGLD